MGHHSVAVVAFCLTLPVSSVRAQAIDQAVRPAVDAISAESLRGHLSFIASDRLEGRDTPSPGLDLAAEYIAAQFRRAGLEPVGDDGFFQTIELQVERRTPAEFELSLAIGEETIGVRPEWVSIVSDAPVQLDAARLVRVAIDDENEDEDLGLTEDLIGGAVVITEIPDFRSIRDRRRMARVFTLVRALSELGAALIITVDREAETGAGLGRGRLVGSRRGGRRSGPFGSVPMVRLHGASLVARLDALGTGATGPVEATVTARLPELQPTTVTTRNVVGLLRGSDEALAERCVILSAHYDHVGVGSPDGNGDAIYNGANDDGSGTVSLIEIAGALGSLEQRPRRSVLLLALCGEERGLIGSRHYVEHPIIPLEKTIANVNLEHVGRTDDTDEPKAGRVMLTGHGYSSVTAVMEDAADATGMELYHHARNCDVFFARSDNVSFARLGVPAHTLCTAFIFPEYHRPGDHWELVDYDNMAAVNRLLVVALWRLANDETEPRWDEEHRRTAEYVEAWKTMRGG
jgi:hypothetical protein